MTAPAAATAGKTVALLCSDLAAGPCPVPVGEVAASLRRGAAGVGVFVVERLCANPPILAATLGHLGADRVLVGCRAGPRRREEIRLALARSDARRAAVCILDLTAAAGADAAVVAEQSLIALRAALARLLHRQFGVPAPRRMLAADGVNRRELFRTAGLTSQPVACLQAERCTSALGCRACTLACPAGALRRAGTRIVVDAAACSACGACLSACRQDAISLEGEVLGGFEAAARTLADELSRTGASTAKGVAISCRRAPPLPLGGEWMSLEVPSLQLVSPGWLLQLRSAGVEAAVLSCEDETCRQVADALTAFCDSVAAWSGTDDGVGGTRRSPVLAAAVELREPVASVRPLRGALQQSTDVGRPARLESAVAPLGEVGIAEERCSACVLCSAACPTGALTGRTEDGQFLLEFDAADCSACGACVVACPEGIVSLRRVVDPESLTGGRRPIASTPVGGRCSSCGQPLTAGIAPGLIEERLASSHPALAARLRSGRCLDCLLGGGAAARLASAEVGLTAVPQ